MQRRRTFGGGVSPRNTRLRGQSIIVYGLRGQSIIEYVLIIAVIGLVIVFAGPGVAGVIRNQFSQVTNTVDAGTEGGSFLSAEEKAYREAMKTVASKEAKDWTLDEQKAAATDIAKNGTSSVAYAKAKAAMDAGTTWSVKLTNGQTMTYRIIGINHDDLADESGKAGLTFESTRAITRDVDRLVEDRALGGWEKCAGRVKLNSGEIWNLMPAEFQSNIRTVKKTTNCTDGTDANAALTTTTDKVFILSSTEIADDGHMDGRQYEFYKERNGIVRVDDSLDRWTRSLSAYSKYGLFEYYRGSYGFGRNGFNGSKFGGTYLYPAFCF